MPPAATVSGPMTTILACMRIVSRLDTRFARPAVVTATSHLPLLRCQDPLLVSTASGRESSRMTMLKKKVTFSARRVTPSTSLLPLISTRCQARTPQPSTLRMNLTSKSNADRIESRATLPSVKSSTCIAAI